MEEHGAEPEDDFDPFFYEVSIVQEVIKKAEHKNKAKVILIDLLSLQNNVYCKTGRLDVICGGQFAEYVAVWKAILNKFKANDIELVFIKDGPSPAFKRDAWVKRRYSNMNQFGMPVFNSLNKGQYPDMEKFGSINLPTLQTGNMLKHILNVRVITTTSNVEADEMVVKMAHELNAAAILAQDSDYIIYDLPEDCLYLSAQHFNFDDLTTFVYDRNRLAKYLQIQLGHLPLLAIMKGNDSFSEPMYSDFHKGIVTRGRSYQLQRVKKKSYAHLKIECIALFINDAELPDNLEEQIKELPKLLPFILNKDINSEDCIEEASRLLKGYFLKAEKHDENLPEQLKFLPSKRLRFLALEGKFQSGYILEDHEMFHEIPPAAQIYLERRRRMYGVLFNDVRNRDSVIVQESCMAGPGSLDEPKPIRPIWVPDFHPGLRALNDPDDSTVTDEVRWKLLAFTVSPKMDWTLLASLPEEDIFIATNLYALQNNCDSPILYKWEIDAFIAHHFVRRKMSVLELGQIKVIPDPRGAQLAAIYTSSNWTNLFKLIRPPFPITRILNAENMDGKLFQSIYLGMKNGEKSFDDYQSKFNIDSEAVKEVLNFATMNGSQVKPDM